MAIGILVILEFFKVFFDHNSQKRLGFLSTCLFINTSVPWLLVLFSFKPSVTVLFSSFMEMYPLRLISFVVSQKGSISMAAVFFS